MPVSIVRPDQRAACHAIRRRVFVEGQGVPAEIEEDGRDDLAVHLAAWDDAGHLVGTARLRIIDGVVKAERVAVLEGARGAGHGRALMAAIEAHARDLGIPEVLLHAQASVVPFYARLGYEPVGEGFVEAGIPHQAMRRPISPSSTPGASSSSAQGAP